MDFFVTVLRKRLCEYEGVELNIGIAVSKALEDGRYDVSCAGKRLIICRSRNEGGEGLTLVLLHPELYRTNLE